MNISLSPFAPENFVSRDGFGVQSRVSLLISILKTESCAYSRDSSRFPRGVHLFILNRRAPSGQSRVNPFTHLRTDGVHCRESAGTGPAALKVVPVTGAAILQVTMDQSINVRLCLFSHPSPYYYRYEVVIAC